MLVKPRPPLPLTCSATHLSHSERLLETWVQGRVRPDMYTHAVPTVSQRVMWRPSDAYVAGICGSGGRCVSQVMCGEQADLMWRALHRRETKPSVAPMSVQLPAPFQESVIRRRGRCSSDRWFGAGAAASQPHVGGPPVSTFLPPANSGAGSANLDHVGSDQRHWCIRQRVDLSG